MSFWKVTTLAESRRVQDQRPDDLAADRRSPDERRTAGDVDVHRAGACGKTAAAGIPLETPGTRGIQRTRKSRRAVALQDAAVKVQKTAGRQAGSAVGLKRTAGDHGVARVVIASRKDRGARSGMIDGAAAADRAAIGGGDAASGSEIQRTDWKLIVPLKFEVRQAPRCRRR